MNIRINFDYYDQILNVYGRIISKKQTSYTSEYIEETKSKSLSQNINVYVAKSIITLKKVIQLALSSKNENLAYAALEVFNYLTLSGNMISDHNKNYMDYFDDAWLIHNFARYCVDKGYFPEEAFNDEALGNAQIDTYLSNSACENIYSNLCKTLNKIIKEYQI